MVQITDSIVEQIAQKLQQALFIEVEASGRHIHLSKADADYLFGENYNFTKLKDLSQPGQYACKERVTIVGPKGSIANVIVLGPERKETQLEISLTDSLILGLKPPIRQSGDIGATPGFQIVVGERKLDKAKGAIVAKRHVHMTPEDAKKFHITDGEIIKLKVFGERPLIFDDVVARVNPNFATYVHIDYDEANACGFTKGTKSLILK